MKKPYIPFLVVYGIFMIILVQLIIKSLKM